MRHKDHDMLLPLDHMHGIKSNILDQTGKRIARCDFDGEMCAEADANAAYIIKCVNEQQKLESENQRLRDELSELHEAMRRDEAMALMAGARETVFKFNEYVAESQQLRERLRESTELLERLADVLSEPDVTAIDQQIAANEAALTE